MVFKLAMDIFFCVYSLMSTKSSAAKALAHPVRENQSSGRYAFIDSLRGIAALMVIYLHMAGHLRVHELIGNGIEDWLLWFFKYVIDLGKVGVVVFFAVSGFVIPFTLTKGNKAPLRRFLISRFFRLYPAYWLSVALGTVGVWLLADKAPGFATYLVNLTMLQQFVGVTNILGLYWTLQIELVFYALCVGLFLMGWLGNRRKNFYIALLMLAIALALAAARLTLNMKLPVALFLALGFMFWGCVWRDWVIDGVKEARKLGLIWLGAFVVLMPVISLMAYNMDMGFDETWYRYLLSYYVAATILVACTTKFRLEGAVFSWLGRISYSVYLFHSIIISLVSIYVMPVFGKTIPAHGYIVLVVALTLVACHAIYTWIEVPCIKIGRELIRKMDAR